MKNTSMNDLLQSPGREFETLKRAIHQEMHTALPGIVQSYDKTTQTATIQPAIRSKKNGVNFDLPLLTDVPVYFPGNSTQAITYPISPGDDCLVVFSESCIDAWYQSGKVGNAISLRRHDYSDGFAFVGFRSLAKKLENVSDNPDVFGMKPSDVIDDTAGSGDTEKTWSADKLVNEFEATKSQGVAVTALATGWTSTAPYTNTISVTGMTATKNIVVGLSGTATAAQYEAAIDARLLCTAQGAGTITMTAFEGKPTVDIPISVLILR